MGALSQNWQVRFNKWKNPRTAVQRLNYFSCNFQPWMKYMLSCISCLGATKQLSFPHSLMLTGAATVLLQVPLTLSLF